MQNRTMSTSLSKQSSWKDSWITKKRCQNHADNIGKFIIMLCWMKAYYVFMGVPDNTNKDV